MASLSLSHICKKYPNGFEAVKDFNLTIEDKEFIIIVGPSGCGKSTTLRMIAGLEEITSGELKIDGTVVNNVQPKDRDIAMVFQSYALYPRMSVKDNMAFSLRLKNVPQAEIDKKVKEAAKILDLEDLLDRKPQALSGGQRQRVAMGRAIVREPKVFLMDEPLSNLDAKLRVRMRTEISRLHQRLGATIIYVTHDQTEAMTLGTRIVVMKDGVVQQVDTPQALYERPQNLFVAGFIGSPQMNTAEAAVEAEGEDVYLKIESNARRGFAEQEKEFKQKQGQSQEQIQEQKQDKKRNKDQNKVQDTDKNQKAAEACPSSSAVGLAARIKLPAQKAEKLIAGGYIGKTVILGIRPEDITDDPEAIAMPGAVLLETRIEVYELLGAEVYLYFDVQGNHFTARVNPHTTARAGDMIRFALDVDKIHVFDKETEATITN